MAKEQMSNSEQSIKPEKITLLPSREAPGFRRFPDRRRRKEARQAAISVLLEAARQLGLQDAEAYFATVPPTVIDGVIDTLEHEASVLSLRIIYDPSSPPATLIDYK